jgi:hypothetical protein
VTAVSKKIKRRSEPLQLSFHFKEEPQPTVIPHLQPVEELAVVLPVLSALFKNVSPLMKQAELYVEL